jgi:hypothetical protein
VEIPANERRKNKRFKGELVAQWQRPLSRLSPLSDQWRPLVIRNISKSGLCFDSSESLALSDFLVFKIKVDPLLPPVSCKGEVVRLRPLPKPGMAEVGISFVSIDIKDQDLIDVLAWEQERLS